METDESLDSHFERIERYGNIKHMNTVVSKMARLWVAYWLKKMFDRKVFIEKYI